jgi:hypothetical protein
MSVHERLEDIPDFRIFDGLKLSLASRRRCRMLDVSTCETDLAD